MATYLSHSIVQAHKPSQQFYLFGFKIAMQIHTKLVPHGARLRTMWEDVLTNSIGLSRRHADFIEFVATAICNT